jgi:hypothetical protein
VACRAAMRIVIGVGNLMQRTEYDRTCRVLSGRTIERSCDVVCGLHRTFEDENHGFLGRASKPGSTVCQLFELKTTETVFSVLTLKPVAMFSPGLTSKLVVEGFRFMP